ncbi:MAG: hypothetical protein U0W40_16885 [Acidimicrobiia bacterium]
MTADGSGGGSPEEVAKAYSGFIGRWRQIDEPPEGFSEWIRNLHDVYLNVEVAWLASLFIPPSDIEEDLEAIGGSRRQRLARFLARDVWVLWEAWDRRPQFHDAFAERAPEAVARLRELEATGKSQGWFKKLRATRDYMNHRDKREYRDAGREELPEDAIAWMQALREAFSSILLAAMGMPPLPDEAGGDAHPLSETSMPREVATSAVDDLLIGTVSAFGNDSQEPPPSAAIVAGHFGRAFTSVACGSPALWSETLTALIRRSVIAWSRLEPFPQLREVVEELELEPGSRSFLIAVTTGGAEEYHDASLAERSRLAVFRVTAWFNGHGDLSATLGAAVSVAGVLVTFAVSLAEEDEDLELAVRKLGAEADALLTAPDLG